jgi:aspartate carbamoyltransferase
MDLLSVLDLTLKGINHLIARAEYYKYCYELKRENLDVLKNKTLVNVFYEPSTRTSSSFQAAMIRMGGNVIQITDKYSSVEKGESLEDTIKTLCYYGDVIVLRHPLKGFVDKAALVSSIPVINAGDGNGEHPTQALLDIFTIKTELEKRGLEFSLMKLTNPITITFVGDLKNSRTIHSLINILNMLPGINYIFIYPDELKMPKDILNQLSTYQYQRVMSVKEALQITDILYVTRIQKERFEDLKVYEEIINKNEYCINNEILKDAKKDMIIMHPLPRLNEIHPEVDNDPRACYFEQVNNGIYVRMAILELMIGGTHEQNELWFM